MPNVEQIKAAISENHAMVEEAMFCQMLRKSLTAEDFGARVERRRKGVHAGCFPMDCCGTEPVASPRMAASNSCDVTVAVPRFMTTMPPAILAICAASTNVAAEARASVRPAITG